MTEPSAKRPSSTPDDVSEIPEPVILNPSAVGNPDEDPKVWLPPSMVAYFNPCKGGPEGWCGGVNGFHQDTCTVAGR